MSSSSNDNQSPTKNNQRNGLPPQIPLNKQQIPLNIQHIHPTISKDHKNIPNLDSNFIFQSNNLSKDNQETVSNSSLNQNQSSQFKLGHFTNDSTFIRDNGSIEVFNAKQQTNDQKLPTEINIDSYFDDFYRREIEASQSATKEECISIVEPYSIEHYAATYFRPQLTVVILNKQGIKKLTTFSEKPFTRPLLKKIPLKKKAAVKRLATFILIYIGVYHDEIQDLYYKNKKDEQMKSLFLAIMYMLHNDETLIDECYMQLIKAMRGIPTEVSLDLCWNLFVTIASLFYVVDWRVQNVVRSFLVSRMFYDDIHGQFARYSFINFHDRLVLERSFDAKTTRKDILEIPNSIQNGKKTFRCSLYIQMWNQRKRYPKLPIPLTLYLVVKTLIKNGALLAPKPFPFLRQITLFTKFKNANIQSSSESNNTNATTNKSNEDTADADNDDEYAEEEEENNDDEKHKAQLKIDLDVIKASNQMFDDKNSTEEEDYKEFDESYDVSSNNAAAADSSDENVPVKRCDMKLIKKWSDLIFDNEDVINDGEINNLMGFLLTWMLNLVDPIVPKSMSKYFIDTFDNPSPSPNDYGDFVENLPLLHKNTLKYIIGFLREIAKNVDLTQESHKTISKSLATYFVMTTFATIEPFTRIKMIEIAPKFLLYCLDNIDVTDVYPLNPAYLVRNEE